MYVGRGVGIALLVACFILVTVGTAWSQSNVFESGRIVRADERAEDIQLGMSYGGDYGLDSGIYAEEEEVPHLPWIPILSPTMICLDCWMTKTYKIWDFYHQQAAQEYFAHSESCADLVLCPDPCVKTALKYTLLAPIYAIRPHLLLRNCSACGISNPYGVPDPMPSVAVNTPSGPQVLTTTPSSDIPTLMPESNPYVLPPSPPVEVPLPGESLPPQSMNTPTRSASASKWSQMSDQEILSHFGLESGSTQTAILDKPTSPTPEWEFADTAPSTSASELIASMEPPAPIAPLPSESKAIRVSTSPSADTGKTSLKKETQEKTFSVTDKEYDRLRDIEKGLLEGSER